MAGVELLSFFARHVEKQRPQHGLGSEGPITRKQVRSAGGSSQIQVLCRRLAGVPSRATTPTSMDALIAEKSRC
jgi:hypothetical protein